MPDALRAAHPLLTKRLEEALLQSDALADDVVRDFATLPQGAGFRLLEQGLALGPEALVQAPLSLHQLLAQAAEKPSWVNMAQAEAGAGALLRAGPAAGIVLGMKSLILGYASPAGNKPLMLSGQLQSRTPMRLAETSRFVQAISQPGGVTRHGQGLAIAVKVRIMHAQVRSLIERAQKNWSPEYGVPINQHDMLATVILFSAALVEGLRQLGYGITSREADDISHLWRYVGWLMGVREDLLPGNHQDALRMADLIQSAQGPPDDDSRTLVAALFGSREQMATTAAQRQRARSRVAIMQAICRHLIGAELADALHIPATRWHLLPLFARPIFGLAARANRLPMLRNAAARAGDAYWKAAVSEVLREDPPFALPKGLMNAQ
ncbi:MAG: oxygenase MpaB family protein [Deltaproteobacteria bacterium]|nr:oxygenase MpaB family protein [Deltaproteobacteria bacterium]